MLSRDLVWVNIVWHRKRPLELAIKALDSKISILGLSIRQLLFAFNGQDAVFNPNGDVIGLNTRQLHAHLFLVFQDVNCH